MESNSLLDLFERSRQIHTDSETFDQRAYQAVDSPLGEPPELGQQYFRSIEHTGEILRPLTPGISLDITRDGILNELFNYAFSDAPATGGLLIQAYPGSGKTKAAAFLAESLAKDGKRVAYYASSHKAFATVTAEGYHPNMWYHMLPRQAEDLPNGKVETCRHADRIGQWLNKGHSGIDFCKGVCGMVYANTECAWHAQKEIKEPIVFLQHPHLWAGTSMQFDVAIVDEFPMSSFENKWNIPVKWVMPEGMRPTTAIGRLFSQLTAACVLGRPMSGPELLNLLGGPELVRDVATVALELMAEAEKMVVPEIRNPSDVERAPYGHVKDTLRLLEREADAALMNKEYPHRVIASNGVLMLLLRRIPASSLAPRLICLDGTGKGYIYEKIFGRPFQVYRAAPKLLGSVYQVYSRSNGIGTLVKTDQPATFEAPDGDTVTPAPVRVVTAKARQLKKMITEICRKHGYKRPGIITHKALASLFDVSGDSDVAFVVGWFFANRGENHFQDCDVLFVAGTPQPGLTDTVATAAMIWDDHMDAFDTTWSTQLKPYTGQPFAFPVPNFYGDAILRAVLSQSREAEIVQSAERLRLRVHDKPVWLLLNLPIDELPPTELIAMHEIYNAPGEAGRASVSDLARWSEVVQFAKSRKDEGSPLSSADLVAQFKLSPPTARRYLNHLLEMFPDEWEVQAIAPKKRGRPARTLQPKR